MIPLEIRIKMANNPLDLPKSKIPIPESPYLSQSRSGYLADLSDQVFFDENVPTPVDPLTKRPKSPPYSYGPPGILHDHGAVAGPAGSPHTRKSRRKRPPDITSTEYVDSRLEDLLGPSVILDVDDRADEILIDSISRRGSGEIFREPKDSLYYHGRHSDRAPRKKTSPNSRLNFGDSLGIPGESEKDGSKVSSKDRPSSRPESRTSMRSSSRPPSDKPSGGPVPSPKKSPAKQSMQKGKETEGKNVKIVVSAVAGKNGTRKAQDSLVKSDAASLPKDAAGAGAKGKAASEGKGNGAKESEKEKDKSQKPAGDGDSKDKQKEANGEPKKKEPPSPDKPSIGGIGFHGPPGVDLSKLDEHKREEVMRDYAAARKLLHLCQSGDWNAVENQLRYFERRQQQSDIAAHYKPLAAIKDEVL